jgi:hypothetical protein
MAGNFDQGVAAVTQDQYCRKQVAEGLSASTCAERYNAWRQQTQGKGSLMAERWRQ